MSDATQKKNAIWFSLPFIIGAGCLIAMISFGPRSTLGLFLSPMTEFRGWSVSTFSFALALQNLMWGAGQPFAGAMADKYGTARVLSLGAIVYAIGLIIMANAEATLWLHLGAGVLIGLGMSAASFSIVLSAFGRAVTPGQRSMAFGIGTAAGSLGQFVFAIGAGAFIASAGWQATLYIFAALTLLIVPLSFILQTRKTAGPQITQANEPQQTLSQALKLASKHPSYLLLVAGFFVCGFHVAFIAVHLPPFLKDLGFDVQLAGLAIAFIGGFNIIGSLASGYIGTHFPKQYFLAFIYLARAVVIVLFLMVPVTPFTVLAFASAMGLLWLSTVPPTSSLVATMFGPRYMATLFGIVFFSHQVGAFIGVWLGGALYDIYGSYDVVWYLGIALSIFAAIIHWPIKEEPVGYLEPVS